MSLAPCHTRFAVFQGLVRLVRYNGFAKSGKNHSTESVKSCSQVLRMAGLNVPPQCVFQICGGTFPHFILV